MNKFVMKFVKTKYIFIVVICLLAITVVNNPVFAGAGPSITMTCGSEIGDGNWPRNTFSSTCSLSCKKIDSAKTYSVGVYTDNYTTTKTSGNGSNITYTSPEYRFKVDGPAQGGTPENITTNSAESTIIKVKSGITGVTQDDFSITLYYTTYEADYGGTAYSQGINVILFDGTASAATNNDTLSFDIENKQYITVSSPPSVTLTTSSEVFTLNQDYDSNTLNVNVKANNVWTLETQLDADLISGGDTIQEDSNYFRASGSGFTNLASTKTQFVRINNFYDIAESSTGVNRTGTSDDINLTGVDVSVIYTLKTIDVFAKGIYTAPTEIKLSSP